MNLFTVHPDESIDPFIMGYVTDQEGPELIAQLIVNDENGIVFPIGNKVVPIGVSYIDASLGVPVQIPKAISIHAALVLFITQPHHTLPVNFHPSFSLSSFCCGEIISQQNQNQLASLWFMNSPGCIVHGGTHWSLQKGDYLLPTKL